MRFEALSAFESTSNELGQFTVELLRPECQGQDSPGHSLNSLLRSIFLLSEGVVQVVNAGDQACKEGQELTVQ